ncbi:hypothetical protein KIV63_gp23 [Mycobacterium phage SWU2]|uniref:Uncharacterized protein n=1 Tax=Mycobacterium phage SWU2 TaxID=2077150 RepID=A0A2K9VI46_9CAUD|nr:hypothetical protein KIV63_gp23 [Mycobacterium phage SWU2]AUV62021.1 hypothetical protein JX_gp62 [Mycobacterium phage SWU2]
MTATPNAMPRKANPIRQQVLSALIETKAVTTTFKRDTTPHEKKPTIEERKVTRLRLRFPLAQNVSDLNVDRAAKAWIA